MINPLLIPFETVRNPKASLALRNPSALTATDAHLMHRFNWMVAGQTATGNEERRLFHAERYGGHGIGVNGGGARCGVDGEYQIKGIGPNPLVGEDANFWYAHGQLALADALQESIWGEVLHLALPYGAVRVPAVIATGTECWIRGPMGEKNTAPRALAVREQAWRPAHFQRAVYFRPQREYRHTLALDAERVRAAMAWLPDLLPLPSALSATEAAQLSPIDKLHFGLTEMVRRFAEQNAAAKAKRIMHGAIGASNCCLDGRWIDYGSVTALPGFANSCDFTPSFWADQMALATVIADTCYYIGKYFPTEDKAALPQAQPLLQIFGETFQAALSRRFLSLTGLPENLLENHWQRPEPVRLAELIVRLAQSGTTSRLPSESEALAGVGDFRLGAILTALAHWHDHPEAEARLSPLLPAAPLREQTLTAYRACMDLARGEAAQLGIAAEPLRRVCQLNAMKSARGMPELYSYNLTRRTRQLLEDHPDPDSLRPAAEALLNELSDHARFIWQDPQTAWTRVYQQGNTRVEFNAVSNRWQWFHDGLREELPDTSLHTHPALAAMRRFWGDPLLEILS